MSDKIPFRTSQLQKELMARYYAAAAEARAAGVPVAWVTAVFPVEIVYAAGVFPYYPENFGALAAARRVAGKLSAAAEARGYFYDLCGYARCGIGDAYSQEHPVGAIEKPDILLCANTQCGSLPKWFEAAARFYRVSFFLLDTPLVDKGNSQTVKDYFVLQLQEMIAFLERATGRTFDYRRLGEVLQLSNEACRLWNEILDTAALKPAPFGFFDACLHMAPIVTWRGTREAVDYYRALRREIQERMAQGIYALPGERYKIYWDHIPVWPRLKWFGDLFAAHGALAVVSQYTHSWAYAFDPDRPLESLAENYVSAYINHDFRRRIDLKIQLMNKYRVDGFVLFSNRSCKPNALGLYDKSNEISRLTGLPGVVFEADMADLRFFSEAQVQEKMEVLFEQLASR